MDDIAVKIEQASKISNIGRSKLYQEIGAGRLKARKVGRSTIILVSDLKAWLECQPAFTSKEGRQ